ncbi:polysaccharide pyruvyl transferase family protein [Shewanella sp. YLB-07]|uniref:polysaccharide pyruvyl transferase family protein n=1 Tax=Shewanella sp. YLB-07 TaxID=2601268 RepID=UPI00128CBEB4|nr:polysaccharide pyruvyl transferase family protein [Shewanella sp. YLB-07]MPY24863.1 polysaccharide pyruvyl transferase family protein [Shewanella sp. YLB-07]
MRILHIAAFEGNVGDNASHIGFQNILNEIDVDCKIDRLEIRKAYNNYNGIDKVIFNEDFSFLANKYDLVVFGGGGFLDYWVENSHNGTTINIPNYIFDKIETPILITSVGCNPHRTVPEENYKKFKLFLDYVLTNKNITIALRNDGSINSIVDDFGEKYLACFSFILDNGFFYEPMSHKTLPIDGKYVAVNITNDQLEMSGIELSDANWYYNELELTINELIARGFKIVFVPHIHQDIIAISELLKKLPANTIRKSTVVAPCVQGDEGTDFIFNIYKNADLVIASRYHSNVCSLKFNVPTIGLSPLARISYVHSQLSVYESSFYIEKGFSKKIVKLLNEKLIKNLNLIKFKSEKEKTLRFYKEYFESLTVC